MADQVVPLSTQPVQTFQIPLNVAGEVIRLNLTIKYNEMAAYWTMDITDSNNNPVLASVPLITGTWPAANILAQYQYLGIGSAYVVNVGNNPLDYPNNASLGNDFILIWSDPTT
jgi:hypothetical protein